MKVLTDHEGRVIRLTDERLAHILEHPEMEGLQDWMAEALRIPERVLESPSDPGVRLYYGVRAGTRVGIKHLCVVVKVADNDALVLTAYLTARPSGGRQLWPKGD